MTAPGPLEFVDGRFAGIAQGTLLTDAAEALGVAPQLLFDTEPLPGVGVCNGTEAPWVIRTGGLQLVFEDLEGSADTAFLTNWGYIGGPVAGFTEMIAPRGIKIGMTRQELLDAYPEVEDPYHDTEIYVYEPVSMRFGLTDDTVQWFGIVDCVFEGVPAD